MTDRERIHRRKALGYGLAGLTAMTAGTVGGLAWLRRRKRQLDSAYSLATDGVGLVDPTARVTKRRRLGRTNLAVSVVGIGAGGVEGIEPIARAVDKGMNYIDTATCYAGSEDTLGRAFLAYRGLRDKLIVATKWDPVPSTTKNEMLESLDQSLRRMRTDHVDIMQVHWLGGGHKSPDNGFNRLDNEELYHAMEEAKRAGKARFFGATSHHANRSAILQHAIDRGFDMVLVKMNVLDYETADMPALLAKAKTHDVGVVVMKSQPAGGRIPKEYEGSRYSIFQANLRWVLSHSEVHSVVHSWMGTDARAQDLAASAVRDELGANDVELLDEYAAALSPSYCRECSAGCVDACPAGIAIPHVMHAAMYDRDYAWHEAAREVYRGLPEAARWSDTCLSCSRCTQACPWGVDAAGTIRLAKGRMG